MARELFRRRVYVVEMFLCLTIFPTPLITSFLHFLCHGIEKKIVPLVNSVTTYYSTVVGFSLSHFIFYSSRFRDWSCTENFDLI